MRHRKTLKKLGRKSSYRKALMSNLVNDLLLHGKLQTTQAKAKVLRGAIDRVISLGKRGENLNTLRLLKSYGVREEASRKLFTHYMKRFADRSSGFTTMSPVKIRKGDNALVLQISLLP